MGSFASSDGAPGAREERSKRLKSLLQADPGNERLARECIEAAVACGDYDFVLAHAQQVLSRSPQDLSARFDCATALIAKRDYAQAIAVLEEITAEHPQVIAAQINLGLCYYVLLQYVKARTPLEKAYQAGDHSSGLLRLLVSTYHHLGLVKEAVRVADTGPDPQDSDAALAGVYALAYLDAGNAVRAARWAAQALAQDGNSIDGVIVQAALDTVQGDIAHARERYERVLALAPATGRAWVGLGALALLVQDLPRARELLTRGVELMPGHVGSWHTLAWAHLLAGDLERAEASLQTALQLDRNFAETHGGLASVAALRGERESAERSIEIALRLDPACLSAQFARSVLMGRAGDAAGGQALIHKTFAALGQDQGAILGRLLEEASRRR